MTRLFLKLGRDDDNILFFHTIKFIKLRLDHDVIGVLANSDFTLLMMTKTLYLREELANAWQGKDIFSLLNTIDGEVFRDKEGRRTLRIAINESSYFLKYHRGVGWGEIIKNWLSFRSPIVSARNEWQAVKFLQRHQLETMTIAAYGEVGKNPAKRHSFVITEDLVDTMSLEHLGQQWRQLPPRFSSKYQLIKKLAHIAGTMHANGMNHRDFYLCHFLLDKKFADHNTFDGSMPIYLIDLHRAQIRNEIPERWVIKDLGSLYFSAYDVALTPRDLLRFIKVYTGLPLRQALSGKQDFWKKVQQRADALFHE